jgi:redox-sensitive bicupin YhaK (pirin superfamily)
VFGPGDHLVLRGGRPEAGEREDLDVLLLGGRPIGEPISHYGPFVMNTDDEIRQAITDFQEGRLGTIPADQLAPRKFGVS